MNDHLPPWKRLTIKSSPILPTIVALDPGLAKFGLVAVNTDCHKHVGVGYEVFSTETYTRKYEHAAMGDLLRRAKLVDQWFGDQIDKYNPCAVAAEELSFPRDMRAGAMLAMAWGLIVSQLERRRLPLVCARPSEWRTALIGIDTRPKAKGERARRMRIAQREQQAHAEAGNRVPGMGRAIKATVKRELQEHVFDALGVFCWSVDTNVVRSAVRRG